MPLTREAFVHRWKLNVSSESQASQAHFIDLCDMLGVPAPNADPAQSETYTFEKPVSKVYGGKGAADVWKRGYFAWEYKSRNLDLRTVDGLSVRARLSISRRSARRANQPENPSS